MLQADRLRAIVERVKLHSSVRVVTLAREFGVTGETIRRDLDILDKEGLVRKVHGGAVDVKQSAVQLYNEREMHRTKEKRAIGELAATLVKDGDTIIVDVGTTVLAFCAFLYGKSRLTVLTPSIQAAQLVKQVSTARIIVLGGELQEDEPYLNGYIPIEVLKQFHADIAFISVGGISFERGLTDFRDSEVQVRKAICRSTSRVIVLADSSKIGVRAMSVIGDLELMDVLVTDSGISAEVVSKLEHMGIEVMVVKG